MRALGAAAGRRADRPSVAAGLAVLLCAAGACLGGGRVIIENVDRYRVVEPLYECVRVVLAQRGEKHTAAYVQGISGAAFRVTGPCPCAPTCGGVMNTDELVRLLGYEATWLKLYGPGVDLKKATAKAVARVKDEIRAGRAAIVWHAFTAAEWDVVCGFDEQNRRFIGRGSYRGLDRCAEEDEGRTSTCGEICPQLGVILVGGKTGRFGAKAAELAALAEAVRHAHSPADRFLAETDGWPIPWRFRNGLACYDYWIRSFRGGAKRDVNMGDRYCLGVFRSTHRAAGQFMRQMAAKYAAAKPSFERAAGQFAAEADAFDKAYALATSKAPKETVPLRNRRIADFLAAARKSYAGAIDQVESGLRSIDADAAAGARRRPWVRRENGKVWIHGTGELGWDRGRDCTFAGSLDAATKVTDRPCAYTDVMGLTGLAFRVRWANEQTKTKWCPSCPIGEMPDEHDAVTRLIGWKLQTEWVDVKGRDVEKLRKRIVAAIDAGRPVLTYPETMDMGVVYGYADGGRTVLVRDYEAGEGEKQLAIEKLGPMQTYLGGCKEVPPIRFCLRQALETAVRNWKLACHDGGLEGREYWYGEAALGAWIDDLHGYDKLSEEARGGLRGLHGWNLSSLADARRAAVQFLIDWSQLADGKAAEAMRRAAELYGKEAEALGPVVQSGSSGAKRPAWPRQARAKAADALREAKRLEARAIAELEKAAAMK